MVKITIEVEEDDVTLKRIERKIMALSVDVQDFSSKVDQATTEIANRLQKLMDRQTGISAEDKGEFSRIVGVLTALGHDPEENPLSTVESFRGKNS